jgi:Flp pilus assembly protein TadG
MMGHLRAFLRSESRGVAALELAIAAPVLAFLLIAAVDFSIGQYTKFQLRSAAQAGAEYAAVSGYDASAISSAATSSTSLANISVSSSKTCGCVSSNTVVTNSCSSPCANGATLGTYATVTATKSFSTLLSYPMIPATYDLTATSKVRIQ